MTTDVNTPSLPLDKLFAALAKAQGQIEGASKDKVNPHFKSRYADLASIWDACRKALSDNGLAVIQFPVSDGDLVGVRTILGHSSGQSVESVAWTMPQAKGPQALGSCVTYLRRYSLAAAVGVAPDEDDDGNGATGRADPKAPAPQETVPPAAGKTAHTTRGAPKASPPPVHYEVDPVIMAKVTRLLNELGWAKPHAVNWLKKHFQSDTFAKLTATQVETVAEKLEMELEVTLAEQAKKEAERLAASDISEGGIL